MIRHPKRKEIRFFASLASPMGSGQAFAVKNSGQRSQVKGQSNPWSSAAISTAGLRLAGGKICEICVICGFVKIFFKKYLTIGF